MWSQCMAIAGMIVLSFGATQCSTKSTDGDPSDERYIVLGLAKEHLTEIRLADADGEHALIRDEDSHWYYAGMELVDSTQMTQYLINATTLSSDAYIDELPEHAEWHATLRLQEGMAPPVEITCYVHSATPDRYILHSTTSQEVYFQSDGAGEYDLLFGKLYRILDAL